ncbi:hypothetical protein GCM10009087_49690 [Sphingomonas oligophenolica]|uniref:Glutaredoxin family protein n=1 Tax=Sphingomonas oligophenolica TaxID=301154 RepID=A0ABU9YB99_9SPHN
MPDVDPEIVFYWVPGCANCTRLKGYLTRRGVAYRAVNVQAEPAALEAIAGAGLRALPALRVGERWVPTEEADINTALGLAAEAERPPLPPPAELIERCGRMLDLASTLATQLPPEHFDDPTPTMADFVSAGRFMADGQPYLPHGTSKSLVHHIAQHGEKAIRLVRASDGIHELGFAIDGTGDYTKSH